MGNNPTTFLTPQVTRKDSPLVLDPPNIQRLNQSAARFRALGRLRSDDWSAGAKVLFSTLSAKEKRAIKESWKSRRPAVPPSSVAVALLRTLPPGTPAGEPATSEEEPCPAMLEAAVKIVHEERRIFARRLDTVNATEDEIRNSRKVRDFAFRFETFLDRVIDLLDTPDECAPVIVRLGQHHMAYNVVFEADTLLLIKRSIVDAVCAEQAESVRIAWLKFFAEITRELKRTFHSEVHRKNSRQHTHDVIRRSSAGSVIVSILSPLVTQCGLGGSTSDVQEESSYSENYN